MAQIGKLVKRVGIEERVSGALKYAADMKFANALHVKLVRLDVGHARINSIDTTEAYRLEGVHFVLTDKDLPQPVARYGPFLDDQPIIATGEVKFFGDPVAAVVAETEDIAAKAASLVKVDYEELPGIYSLEQAMNPDAPLVQDPAIRPGQTFAKTNILDEWNFKWGEPETTAADLVVEDAFTFPMTTHFAIEPHVFVAAPEHDGVCIWSTVQHPFLLQRVVARALKMPVSKVRVVVPELGGGFGGKGYPKFEPLMAFLAMKLNRTVKLRLDCINVADEVYLLRNGSGLGISASQYGQRRTFLAGLSVLW